MAKAQADKAYEIQTNVMQPQVVVESVRVQQVEREQQIKAKGQVEKDDEVTRLLDALKNRRRA